MFSFRNGILRIGQEKPGLDTFVDAGFFLLLCSQFSTPVTAYNGGNYFYYFAFFLFLGSTIIKLFSLFKKQGTIVLPTITIWFGVFILLALASVLWAEHPSTSLKVMSRLLQSLVITFCMAQNYATRKNFLKCIRMFSWAGIYALVYIMINTPVDKWFAGKFGHYTTALNASTIGMVFTICVLVSFFFAFYCKEKKYYIFSGLQFFAIVLTSSRKSLLTSVAGIMVLILMKSQRRNIIWRIITVLGFAIAVFYLIMTVPELYDTIGVRIETMLEYFETDSGDYSIALRKRFIENARDMFYEKPILGYGINNFVSKIGQRIGVWTYAHNNYYEILADLGIVGFLTYYSYYIYLMASLFKAWYKGCGSIVKLMIVLLGAIMICEYGLVSYYQVYIHVTICCAYLFLCACDSEDDLSESNRFIRINALYNC